MFWQRFPSTPREKSLKTERKEGRTGKGREEKCTLPVLADWLFDGTLLQCSVRWFTAQPQPSPSACTEPKGQREAKAFCLLNYFLSMPPSLGMSWPSRFSIVCWSFSKPLFPKLTLLPAFFPGFPPTRHQLLSFAIVCFLLIYLTVFSQNVLCWAIFPPWESSELLKLRHIPLLFLWETPRQVKTDKWQLVSKVGSAPCVARCPCLEHRLLSSELLLHWRRVWGRLI